MSDKPPRKTARGTYLYADLDMEKEYQCHKCGLVKKPYMVWIKGKLCLPFCSFNCSMTVYVQNDMQPKRDMMFQGEKGVRKFHLVQKRQLPSPKRVEEAGWEDVDVSMDMDMSRDDYLLDKIRESGVTVELEEIPSFNTWEGFGFLFRWAYSQDWWEEFAKVEYEFGIEMGSSMPVSWVDPRRFADELFGFL